jgi:hypothetical protein
MRFNTLTTHLETVMATKSPAPSRQAQPTNGGNKPVDTLRYGNLKATIWKNQGQSGPFYTVTFTRSYRDDDEQWHEVTSFNTGDLPTLAKLTLDAHSIIIREERKERRTQADSDADSGSKGGRR